MRRLLMVSPHFPPDSTAATHRVRLLAPHLPACGWEPTVLTVDPRDYEGHLDPLLAESVPPAVRVVRARAWPVCMTRAIGVGDLGLRAFAGLRRAAYRLARTECFDALFVTIYPTYPALLGPMLKRRFGLPFVLDYQDPWVGAWGHSVGPARGGRPDLKSRASRYLAERLEPLALRAADAVTAVSCATYAQALARTPTAHPVAVAELPIGWDRRDFDVLRSSGDRAPHRNDNSFRIVYVGTVWPAATETLRAVLAAVASIRAADANAAALRLHFVGTSSQRIDDAPPTVVPIARRFGVDDIVTECARRIDYFDALRELRDADAVLLIGSNEPHYTPSKLFQVLLSERPVVAVLHEGSAGTELLRRAGRPPDVRLITFSDSEPVERRVDAIAAELSQLLAEPDYRPDALDRSVLQPTSAPALAARLAGVLDRVVARERTPSEPLPLAANA